MLGSCIRYSTPSSHATPPTGIGTPAFTANANIERWRWSWEASKILLRIWRSYSCRYQSFGICKWRRSVKNNWPGCFHWVVCKYTSVDCLSYGWRSMAIRVCIISIVRVTQVTKGSINDPSCTLSFSEHCKGIESWLYHLGTAVPISTWSAAELAAGVLSACLPVLRPIYAFLINRHSNVPNTLYPRSSSSGSLKNRISGFWWTPTSPDLSSDTRRIDHLPFIQTPIPPNGVEGDRWAEQPISRILPVYQKSRSTEPVARIDTNLEP